MVIKVNETTRCGATGDAIAKVQGRSKIVDIVVGIHIYARKYVCKKCGFEF